VLEFDTVFQQIAIVLVVAAAIGGLALLLRQPLIVGFITAGILVGPQAFGLIESPAEIELLAKIGISLLLFVVGLKLDLRLARTLGPVALATGLGQVLFTSVVGYLIALGLGLDPVAALYVAVALTFSSTIIIVKLLADKGETEDLHGRIAIGFLIVQDIVVVLVMIGLTAFGQPGGAGFATDLALVLLRGGLFIGAIVVAMRWLLPPLLDRLAGSPEVLVLFAITWAVALAAGSDLLGFSEEVGAFIAGVALASTPYREALSGRLTSLRDFLLLFFFLDLGARLDLGHTPDLIGPAVVLSLFVLIGNPIIVMVIMGGMGYRRRTSFLAGLTVAQISEFSLILAALGLGLGHIDESTVGLVTAVGLITIGTSTYLILNSQWLFDRLERPLAIFERRRPDAAPPDERRSYPDVIVIGLGRFGTALASHLEENGVEVLGVDFDPQALRVCEQRGIETLYGDAEDPEFAAVLPLEGAQWVVVSARQLDVSAAVLSALRHRGFEGRVAVSADSHHEAELLEAAGADLVLMPFSQAASQAASLIV
jgi:Kef-type K+ transport system membrane component KefB